VGRFANAIEDGDVDTVVALLTEDAWLTTPPTRTGTKAPRRSETSCASAARATRRRCGGSSRPGPTVSPPSAAISRARTQTARAYGLIVLTLAGGKIAEITFFADSSVFPQFGLPRRVPNQRG
jgi:RNA polymerase sigma-70 factor (ECF subfamily)